MTSASSPLRAFLSWSFVLVATLAGCGDGGSTPTGPAAEDGEADAAKPPTGDGEPARDAGATMDAPFTDAALPGRDAAGTMPAADAALVDPNAPLRSPNGAVEVVVSTAPGLTYGVRFNGQPIVTDAALAIELAGGSALGPSVKERGRSARVVRDEWRPVHGKTSRADDRGHELVLELEETAAPNRRFEVIFRAYDDGVAFRWRFPEQAAIPKVTVNADRSEFRFTADHTVWAARYGRFKGPQERTFDKIQLGGITRLSGMPTAATVDANAIAGLPLLVRVTADAWAAITETDLLDWAGMYLTGGTTPNTVVSLLSPLPNQPGVAVKESARRVSPWRLLLVGNRPGALVESTLVTSLAEPSRVAETSWIRPGRSAWDLWWSGGHAPGVPFKVAMNTDTMKYYVDLAAEMGWEYMLVDWSWYGDILPDPHRPNLALDITKPIAALDLPEVIRHAAARNVKIWLWLHWQHAQAQMDKAFPIYRTWGIAGVKVDFMERDDQEMVRFYERLLDRAAKNQLMVDLHGAYKPTGLSRTYPNLLTQEGVKGNEFNRLDAKGSSPGHQVTLPFTRMLAGPMDFTPGGFRNVTPSSFVRRDVAPVVMGTRAHQLAMLVVYESALQVLCDSPAAYRGQKGSAFLKLPPATWDETRVLDGTPGDFVVIARRAGTTWYLGAMTNESARTIEVPLRFLGPGMFDVRLWEDAADAAQAPEHVDERQRKVTAQEGLKVAMAPGGGLAAVFTPAP